MKRKKEYNYVLENEVWSGGLWCDGGSPTTIEKDWREWRYGNTHTPNSNQRLTSNYKNQPLLIPKPF